MILSFLSLSLLLSVSAPKPAFDEGYDFVFLKMPSRVVLGDNLTIEVRGRPGNAFVVFADASKARFRIGLALFQLAASPAMFPAAFGFQSAKGTSKVSLKIPVIAALDNVKIHFQALAADSSIPGGIGASDSKTVSLHKERSQPLITLLTVNKIPKDMNGSEVLDGVLTVPPVGFTIDLTFNDRGKGTIDQNSLVVTADKALGNGSIRAGANLARFFSFSGNTASALVTTSWAFPAQFLTIKASIKNKNAVSSPTESYFLASDSFSSFNRPFRSKQIWFLDFQSHDLDRSGVPDYAEDLLLFGLGSKAAAKSGPSFDTRQWTERQIVTQLRKNYGVGSKDPVNIDFVLTAPPATHSTICIGGRNAFPKNRLPPGAQETTGAAFVSKWNQNKSNFNCFGFVGVHPRSIFHLFKDVPAFKVVFTSLQANPVGKDPSDAVVTKPGFDPKKGTKAQVKRFREIEAGVMAFARATAFILTQETGHSMGLVWPGANGGGGLMGGVLMGHSTNFHTDDGLGNFTSGNNSTPAPALLPNESLIWDHFQSGRAHFTALVWAYLTERIIQK